VPASIEPLLLEDAPELRPDELPAASVSNPPLDPLLLNEDELFCPLESDEQAPNVRLAIAASAAPAGIVIMGWFMCSPGAQI
jgi:hypothetical protein